MMAPGVIDPRFSPQRVGRAMSPVGGGRYNSTSWRARKIGARSDQDVRAHPHPAKGYQGKKYEGGQTRKEHRDEDAVGRPVWRRRLERRRPTIC